MLKSIKLVRKNRFFPLIPFGPLLVVGGLYVLEVLTFARLRRIAREVLRGGPTVTPA
jgi:hypothetical protein